MTSTKSDAARRIPIAPALVPLLKALYIEAKGKGHVFRLPSPGILSRMLKGYLKRAGGHARRPLRERRDAEGDHVP